MPNNKENKKNYQYAIKSKSLAAVQEVSTTDRTVAAIANTYNYYDSDGDILLPGCASKSIKEHGVNAQSYKIKALSDHDMRRKEGVISVLDERVINGNNVLYHEKIMLNTQNGNDKLIEYKSGAIDQHSIGFKYIKGEWLFKENKENSKKWDAILSTCINANELEKSGSVFVVSEIMLFEISSVSIGANPLTPTLGVKGADKDIFIMRLFSKIDSIEAIIKNGNIQKEEQFFDLLIEKQQLKQMLLNYTNNFNSKENINNEIPLIDWNIVMKNIN